MEILKITPSLDYNDILNLMNQPIKILEKSPKLLSQRMRKLYYKTLGTSVINSPMTIPH